ncbi:guanylate cyclase beta 1 subunit, putative [Perkinsus marinus ATCC 50983]|uniref:Guanylate cyclase beta 1 subunit, putative n=1 Tax=Perkinsus marinus (strain ATCC 50983 / TXsc) TaxID=423536 RepID=C5KST5_PERM5|nr:guanylate cyclase beta 1 subunit, putative [Perkinsus marinus ATCC 50983]EER12285.1 guanylate cyclase beta 1 subunit, putative [Perkinsus marinus ATCC 50983]|eukprot:XP_002780490.1 guanylate cyclase beta 1 subunit, putative [Perkinsus marinus ATCC 50983]
MHSGSFFRRRRFRSNSGSDDRVARGKKNDDDDEELGNAIVECARGENNDKTTKGGSGAHFDGMPLTMAGGLICKCAGGGDDDDDGGAFENFVAFDEVQRRERVWERVGFESEKVRRDRAEHTEGRLTEKITKLRRKLKKATKSTGFIILYYILTIFSLVAPPINSLYNSNVGDQVFGYITLVAAVLFSAEIVIKTVVDPRYLLSLVAFLDIIATLSMVFDIVIELSDKDIAHEMIDFRGYPMLSESGLAEHLQLSRVVRVLTLTRLYRMAKALGMLLEHIRANEMKKLEDDILYRRLQLMFACMDEDNDGYIWPNDFVHAMTYFGLASDSDRTKIARNFAHRPRRQSTFVGYTAARVPPIGGMDFDEFKVEVLELDREHKLRRCARETLNQRTRTYAKLASMAEDTAIRMVLAFVILLISSLYLFNDNTTIHFSTSGLQLVDALYRYGGASEDSLMSVLELQSRLLLASIPDRYTVIYYKIGGFSGPWEIDRLDEERFASKRFFNRLLSQAGLADTIGPPPSSMVIDVESLWIEFAFDSVFTTNVRGNPYDQEKETPKRSRCMAFLGCLPNDRHGDGYFNEITELDQSLTRVQMMISSWAKYCPYDVVRMILRTGEEVELGVAPQKVTIFFSDIEAFTTICEKLTPTQVLRFLSHYFTLVSEIITENQGTLLEVLGDGILAVWNAPLPVGNHAEQCLTAAMIMQTLVARLSEADSTWQQALKSVNKSTLRVRMGIHTGQCLVGNVGAPSRMKYGLLGDRVNTASRLENCNKRYGTRIIISESVWQEPGVADNFVCRPLDRVAVKGKSEGLTILEVLSSRLEASTQQLVLAGLHIRALEAYRNRNFGRAIELLTEAEKRSRTMGESWLAARRLKEEAIYYEANPPPDDAKWDGTTRLVRKSFDESPE